MFLRFLLIGATMGWSAVAVLGQTGATGDDAAQVYHQAAELLSADDARKIMSPSASNSEFVRDYAPLPDDWVKMEKQDYDLHAQVRELFHEAGTMDRADWPRLSPNWPREPTAYLNECRNLANEIGDAAEYQGLVLIDQPDAFASSEDLFRLSDLLRDQPEETLVRLLVASGIDALNDYRLMIIVANAKITEDEHDLNDLPMKTATERIDRFLDHPDAQARVDEVIKSESQQGMAKLSQQRMDRLMETVRRCETERDFVAMSLGAHVYQYKNGTWPANLEELKTELPRIPIDPWGDGKQTLGYALIAHGLPDGTDRPLVYSRCGMKDGLFFRIDGPQYGFYAYDGTKLHLAEQKHGGQFRDLAAWTPKAGTAAGPTTRPLG